jgi:hypothetical protein
MKRWTAAAPVLILFGFGAWMAAADNGRLAKQIASAEVDSLLDAISWTDEQRVALEDVKDAVTTGFHSQLAQLHGLIFGGKRSCPSPRFHAVVPPQGYSMLALRDPQWQTATRLQSTMSTLHRVAIPSYPDSRCWRTLR